MGGPAHATASPLRHRPGITSCLCLLPGPGWRAWACSECGGCECACPASRVCALFNGGHKHTVQQGVCAIHPHGHTCSPPNLEHAFQALPPTPHHPPLLPTDLVRLQETAAIIVEPIVGEGGFLTPPPGFLDALRRICDEHKMLLIFDEVGRGGVWVVESGLYAARWAC